MKVGIIFEEPQRGSPDEEDVLDEVKTVTDALKSMGRQYAVFAINGNVHGGNSHVAGLLDSLSCLLSRLKAYRPSVLFNLVESHVNGVRLIPALTAFFELAGLRYTGCPYDAILTTTDKSLAKAVMLASGIATPAWTGYSGTGLAGAPPPLPIIVKPAWEDASVGIHDAGVITDEPALLALLANLPELYNLHSRQKLLIEHYVEGREFNVSMIEHGGGRVEVLPVAGMDFLDWPAGKPKIVGYDAKWRKDTFEYAHTVRRFVGRFDADEAPVAEMEAMALKCWYAFNLKGYARLDLRMDSEGGLFAIDVNANPGIAPDAGFMAAARQGGYTDADVVRIIIESALMEDAL